MRRALLAALAFLVPSLVTSSTAFALTLSPGACTSGDICIADGNLSGGSLTTSCRVYGWDLLSSESTVTNLANFSYPGPGTGCNTLNVDNTANSSRNRMSTSQRKACYFDASNAIGTVVFIDVYSATTTWKTMPAAAQNLASSFSLYSAGTIGCP